MQIDVDYSTSTEDVSQTTQYNGPLPKVADRELGDLTCHVPVESGLQKRVRTHFLLFDWLQWPGYTDRSLHGTPMMKKEKGAHP